MCYKAIDLHKSRGCYDALYGDLLAMVFPNPAEDGYREITIFMRQGGVETPVNPIPLAELQPIQLSEKVIESCYHVIKNYPHSYKWDIGDNSKVVVQWNGQIWWLYIYINGEQVPANGMEVKYLHDIIETVNKSAVHYHIGLDPEKYYKP